MGKFNGIMLCTDLDGTLLNTEHKISSENTEKIEYFKANGGIFTFITGRMPYNSKNMYISAKPNKPIGCVNGGAIYDFEKNEYVWMSVLDKEYVEVVSFVDENLPEMGIQICCAENLYFAKDNYAMEWFRKITGAPNLVCDYKKPPSAVLKVIFAHHKQEKIFEMIDALKNHPKAYLFDFIRSEKSLFEILPKGNSKGSAMLKMAKRFGIDNKKIIAVGDYDNDVSMIKAAGVGIAVENACEQAKSAADYITVTNDQHAIARIIEDLENGKFAI